MLDNRDPILIALQASIEFCIYNHRYLINDASRVTSLVARTEAGRREGDQLVSRGFKGSLPAFIAAFIEGGNISGKEAEEIEKLLQEYRERR